MLLAFGDESHDGKEEVVFAVSGVIGSQEDWDALSVSWKKRTGGIPFHASDCENGYGPYKDMCVEERQRLYKDLVSMFFYEPICWARQYP